MKYRGLLLPMILAAMCGDGTKVMAYSRKDAIKRLKHKK